jgi:hypothetical protein
MQVIVASTYHDDNVAQRPLLWLRDPGCSLGAKDVAVLLVKLWAYLGAACQLPDLAPADGRGSRATPPPQWFHKLQFRNSEVTRCDSFWDAVKPR